MENKSENRICQNCKTSFVIEIDDFSFYEKMNVPAPVLCPNCRFKRRAIWRNETTLYTGRKCAKCGKSIVSMYNPKSPYTVYCHECYNSDSWDPRDYAMDYNESKPFFEQFGELIKKVPKMTTYITTGLGPNVNSDYTNTAGGNKNCYMVFNSGLNENVLYSRGVTSCRDSLDMYFTTEIELGYELVNTHKASKIIWSKNNPACLDCAFLLNCSGCTNCFGCVNLRNKSYHFFNQPLSKEEYQDKVNKIMGSYREMEKFRKEFEDFSLQFPRRENNNLKTVNCVGDYITEGKNLFNCFEVAEAEDCKNMFSAKKIKDSYDVIGHGYYSELLLECNGTGISSRVIGSSNVENGNNLEYCYFLMPNNKYCFGCNSLRNAEYCILNKQYTKESFDKLRTKIISELKEKNLYGLFMPPELSPFAYNETVAQDNMPLSKEEALKQGWRWEDNLQKTEGKETLKPEQIPDHIKDVQDGITKEILVCISCNRNYKIVPDELLFYRKMNLPLPRKCFSCRHTDRIRRRGPMKFWTRHCAKCNKIITTTFAPDRPEIVYCEKCYQSEVV
ncbi:hypothetical protein A3A09_01870 [Candidatus Nomurabacteria bacterium RIFCSPLOWO2_01_FULL_42_20]|nr:MAG: hypothetical protein A3A09_01870 [Candidatus Nomurabacteria bacterium RIFCSPLOWO2_01_FULL_42_20]